MNKSLSDCLDSNDFCDSRPQLSPVKTRRTDSNVVIHT